ncbi:choline kinase family protein [Labrenzia sp. CE80]|uniref:choline kinase family protein n=1 Tax=Labrenzia sp. CE80 TaxID=1788986 RepID=UPI001389BD5E|nr:choline kinase family protein [Labrenzia sp. CE80]
MNEGAARQTALARCGEAIERHPQLAAITGKLIAARRLPGLTNRVYRIECANGDFVLRLPRVETAMLIDRHAERANLLAAAERGVALAPLLCDVATGVLLSPALDELPDLVSPAALGGLVGRLHGQVEGFEGALDLKMLLQVPSHLDDSLQNRFAPLERALAEHPVKTDAPLVASHCDLSPGNILMTASGPTLIDFEYSGMAPPAWDLAYAVLEHGYDQSSESGFLEAYAAADGNLPEPEALKGMKMHCDAVSSLWALGQAASGNDAEDFLDFAERRIARALRIADGLCR